MNKKERFCDVDNIVEWRHIITALLALVAMTGQGQTKVVGHVINERSDGVDSTTVKQDSIAIRTDSLCQRNVMCNHDTIRKDTCQQQHRLSFVRKEQRPAWSIPSSPHCSPLHYITEMKHLTPESYGVGSSLIIFQIKRNANGTSNKA